MGVLYVVDSVTRQWVDQARKTGQLPGSGAPDGTFAAGVTRVTELLPVLMNDIINSAPEDQQVRFSHEIQARPARVDQVCARTCCVSHAKRHADWDLEVVPKISSFSPRMIIPLTYCDCSLGENQKIS